MRAVSAALLSLFLPLAAAAQGLGPPTGRPVANAEVTAVLTGGRELHIEGLSDDEVPPIFIRLYATGAGVPCARGPNACGFRYYLALQDSHDPPHLSVFTLGVLGEVTKAELITTNGGATGRLRLTVANHPSFAFERDPSLPRRETVYTILLDVNTLRVRREGEPAAHPDPLQPRPVRDPLLVRILNNQGELDIDGVDDGGEPPLILPRLYAVPEEGTCPAGRGEVAGSRHYLALTVGATRSRPSRAALFDLGVLGEVTSARLATTGGSEPPHMLVTVVNYPDWMFAAPDPPARREARFDIVLGADALRVSPVR